LCTIVESVRREIKPEFLCMTNLRKYGNKHYVDVGFRADWVSGEPSPEAEGEFEGFDWYGPDDLPSPLFGVKPPSGSDQTNRTLL